MCFNLVNLPMGGKKQLPGRRYVPARAKTNVTLLNARKNSAVPAAQAKMTTADTRFEIDVLVTRRGRKGRGMIGVLVRICGRVKTRVEECRTARNACGSSLALFCASKLPH